MHATLKRKQIEIKDFEIQCLEDTLEYEEQQLNELLQEKQQTD